MVRRQLSERLRLEIKGIPYRPSIFLIKFSCKYSVLILAKVSSPSIFLMPFPSKYSTFRPV